MVGNLSSVYINNQSSNSYSRIYLGNDGVQSRFNESGHRSHAQSKFVESTTEDINRLNQRNKVFNSANNFQHKQQFEDVMERYQKRTVLFQMMETMGGTGTNDSMSGQFLDTYV